ncbi:MAG: hypothetical protein FWC56_00065 [Phycisphaerae bacterium]|nr:hypothetical protein [Phycisphaerae bacterium]
MNRWQEHFSGQMDALCSQSTSSFDHFVEERIDPAAEELAAFLEKWNYEVTQPASEAGRCTYRFGLTEDAYMLIWFQKEGFDNVQCDYEYSLPGVGRIQVSHTATRQRSADKEWVESCFQTALDAFVNKYTEVINRGGSSSNKQPQQQQLVESAGW